MKHDLKIFAVLVSAILAVPVLIVDQLGSWVIQDTVEHVYYRGDGEWSEDRTTATIYESRHATAKAYQEAVEKSGYCYPYPFIVEEK